MALIKCPGCGKDISDRAMACPKCGYMMSKNNNTNEVHTASNNSVSDSTDKDRITSGINNQSSQGKKNKIVLIGLIIGTIVLGVMCVYMFMKNNTHNEESIVKSKDEQNEGGKKEQKKENSVVGSTNEGANNDDGKGNSTETKGDMSIGLATEGLQEVLIDKDGYYVEYRGIEEKSEDEYIINLYMENNTDEDLNYVFDETSINGFDIIVRNSYIKIPSKSKHLTIPNYEMIIDKEDLAAYNINEIEDFNCIFKVMSEDLSEAFYEEKLVIEGNGNKSEDKTKNEIDIKGTGTTLIDEDGYYVEYRGIEESEDEYIINLYMENNADEDLNYVFDETSINGFDIIVRNSYIKIPSKSKHLTIPNYEMIIDKEDLAAYNIDEIEDISCTFKVMSKDLNEEYWNTDMEISE